MVYPLQHELDERLPLKSCVIGVLQGGQAKAYPVSSVATQKVINDQLGGDPLLILCVDDFMQVYDPRVDSGATLTFSASDGDRFVDQESGSEWSVTGACLAGKYEGRQLAPIPHYNKIFWYVWSDYFPNGEIFGNDDNPTNPA
jgi:hypothetical protein